MQLICLSNLLAYSNSCSPKTMPAKSPLLKCNLVVGKQPDLPLDCYFSRGFYIDILSRLCVCVVGRRIFFSTHMSSRNVTRDMWRQVEIWLGNGTIRCHLGILIGIGSVVYTPDMTFSEESQFNCAFLPHAWFKHIPLLNDMIEVGSDHH